MPINIEKLRCKGVDTLQAKISTTNINPVIDQILYQNEYDLNEVQAFSLKITGYNDRGDNVALLGSVDAVLHKNTGRLRLSENLKPCTCLVFIYTLFIETDFSGCGIASYVLEQLHVWVKEELGCKIDAVLLSPVPQYKNEEGVIVQVPMGVEYLIQFMKLIAFYRERGFNFDDDLFIMSKRIKE